MDTLKISILCLILALGFLVRGYNFSSNPPALNSDEVAIGYNAYSILKTGKDEYGQSFPLAFRSFDDYKPPLYIYLAVPSVAVFGLTPLGVRLPSLVLGLGSIIGIYLLTYELAGKRRLALLAAFFLALAPWHIIFTRSAYESASLLFFLLMGSLFFLKGKTTNFFYVVSALFFALAPFVYQVGKILAPGLALFLLITNLWLTKSQLLKKILVTALFILVLLPGFYTLFASGGAVRFEGLSILADPKIESNLTLKKQSDWLRDDNPSAMAFHVPLKSQFDLVAQGYLSYFRPDFIFYSTDDHRLSYVNGQGLLLLIELPFILLGCYFLFRKANLKNALFVIFWLLLAPFPASVVIGSPNSTRTIGMLVPLIILIAYGVYYTYRRFPKLFLCIFTPLLLLFLATYLHELLVHAPVENSQVWYYGRKEAVAYAERIRSQYKTVYVSNSLDQPYIFFLFYTKRDPYLYQTKDGGTVSGGFRENGNKFANYRFTTLDWTTMQNEEDALFVGLPSDFGEGAPILTPIYSLNGKQAIVFVSKKGPVL